MKKMKDIAQSAILHRNDNARRPRRILTGNFRLADHPLFAGLARSTDPL
jgi:hypothetical protein